MKNLTPPTIAVEFTVAEATLLRAYFRNNGVYDSEIGGPEARSLDALFEGAGIEAGPRD